MIVAGVPCSGKTTLIRNLLAGRFPETSARLGIGNWLRWREVLASDLKTFTEPLPPRLIVHIDFLRWRCQDGNEGRTVQPYLRPFPPRLVQLVESAGSISMLTVVTSLDILIARLHRREFFSYCERYARLAPLARGLAGCPPMAAWVEKLTRRWRPASSKRIRDLFAIYRGPGEIAGVYQRWLARSTRDIPQLASHDLIEFDGKPKFRTPKELGMLTGEQPIASVVCGEEG